MNALNSKDKNAKEGQIIKLEGCTRLRVLSVACAIELNRVWMCMHGR